MPTYEYQCKTCGDVMEVFQSIKAAPLRRAACPTCGAPRPVRRLISAGGAVLFRGPGFYQTDYRSESYKSAVKTETKAAEQSPAAETKKSAQKAGGDGKVPAANVSSESKATPAS